MIAHVRRKYSNIKAMIQNLPQNTNAQKIAVDLLLAYGKQTSTIIENILENAVIASTPVDVNTEVEIKKLRLQTELVNAKTALLFAKKELLEMKQEKEEAFIKQREKEEKEALKEAKKLVANHENSRNTIYHTVSSEMSEFIEAQ